MLVSYKDAFNVLVQAKSTFLKTVLVLLPPASSWTTKSLGEHESEVQSHFRLGGEA